MVTLVQLEQHPVEHAQLAGGTHELFERGLVRVVFGASEKVGVVAGLAQLHEQVHQGAPFGAACAARY